MVDPQGRVNRMLWDPQGHPTGAQASRPLTEDSPLWRMSRNFPDMNITLNLDTGVLQ